MKVLNNVVTITGDELAIAIDAFLVAREVNVHGPRTINIIFIEGSQTIKCVDIDVEIVVAPEGVLVDNR